MSRRPGMGRILKAHPSADKSMFTVFESRDLERPATLPPPLTGILGGDLEEYQHTKKAKLGKKTKAAPVPVIALESTDKSDVSGPVSSMSGPPARAHPRFPPPYIGSTPQSTLSSQYEDLDTCDNDSPTDASMGQAMYQEFGSTGSTLGSGGGGHMAYSQLAVRPSISSPSQFPSGTSTLPPLPGAPAYPSLQYVGSYTHNRPVSFPPATYVAHPVDHASLPPMHTQYQEGYFPTQIGSRLVARQPSTRRTQDGRRAIAPTDPYASYPRQSSARRYNPYARRLPQTARRNQVVEQSASAPAGPAYPVGPYLDAASPFEQQLEAAPDDSPVMPPHGEDFVYPPWSVPRLDTAHVPQLSAATYEGWSPTDEDLQPFREMMDRPYNNGGPSTSHRA